MKTTNSKPAAAAAAAAAVGPISLAVTLGAKRGTDNVESKDNNNNVVLQKHKKPAAYNFCCTNPFLSKCSPIDSDDSQNILLKDIPAKCFPTESSCQMKCRPPLLPPLLDLVLAYDSGTDFKAALDMKEGDRIGSLTERQLRYREELQAAIDTYYHSPLTVEKSDVILKSSLLRILSPDKIGTGLSHDLAVKIGIMMFLPTRDYTNIMTHVFVVQPSFRWHPEFLFMFYRRMFTWSGEFHVFNEFLAKQYASHPLIPDTQVFRNKLKKDQKLAAYLRSDLAHYNETRGRDEIEFDLVLTQSVRENYLYWSNEIKRISHAVVDYLPIGFTYSILEFYLLHHQKNPKHPGKHIHPIAVIDPSAFLRIFQRQVEFKHIYPVIQLLEKTNREMNVIEEPKWWNGIMEEYQKTQDSDDDQLFWTWLRKYEIVLQRYAWYDYNRTRSSDILRELQRIEKMSQDTESMALIKQQITYFKMEAELVKVQQQQQQRNGGSLTASSTRNHALLDHLF